MTTFLIVLARTYPVWATPMAISFIGAALVLMKKNHKGLAIYLLVIGILLAGGVVAYIVFDGHSKFVPMLYDVLITPNSTDGVSF